MITQQEFLRRLIGFLNEAGIPYMMVGSVGSSLHGHPRATQDNVQYSDALGVAAEHWDDLDLRYLREWAGQLGVEDMLARLLQETQERVERTD